jgi:DNA polymerase-3 subunit delta
VSASAAGAANAAARSSAYLVRGDDSSLVAQEVRALLARVVGDRDHALVVEEIGGSPGDELHVGAIVDACLTPPFLVDLRVVVVRDAGRLVTAEVPRLVEVVQEPLPTTVLIVVAGGGTIPAPLVKAISASGEVIDVSTSKAGDRKAWLHEHLRDAPVHLDRGATELLADHVGEDLGRVEGLLSALSAAYGEGAGVSADDLEPYLGEAGNVPRYALTDAINRGEARTALRVLHRLSDAGGLAPMQILATLHGHYANMLALDGEDVMGERDAAAVLGTAPFVAKKALEQSRRLGSERIASAIKLIAAADLDCRGMSGLDPDVVIEILVARLATQTRPARQARGARVQAGSSSGSGSGSRR